jgi:hypothetical protein
LQTASSYAAEIAERSMHCRHPNRNTDQFRPVLAMATNLLCPRGIT